MKFNTVQSPPTTWKWQKVFDGSRHNIIELKKVLEFGSSLKLPPDLTDELTRQLTTDVILTSPIMKQLM